MIEGNKLPVVYHLTVLVISKPENLLCMYDPRLLKIFVL